MYRETIGLVGGFGAYATLDFFKRIIESFPAEKENERPRIIMDNNFPMPSRVRAILYKEHYEQVVEQIAKSVQYMIDGGADKIILVCSTAHAFLPEILKIVPEANEKIVNLMKCIANDLKKSSVYKVGVIGSEGTLDTKVYDNELIKYGIDVYKPEWQKYSEIRLFIESVKQKNITTEILERYMKFCVCLAQKYEIDNIILGCTELPVLENYTKSCNLAEIDKKVSEAYFKIAFWDPLNSALDFLKHNLK